MTIRQNIQWIIFKYLKDNPSHKVRDRLIEKYPFITLGVINLISVTLRCVTTLHMQLF